MNSKSYFRVMVAVLAGVAVMGMALPALAQQHGGEQHGGGNPPPQQQQQQQRPQQPPQRQQPPAQEHARREVVRTKNYVQQPGQIPERTSRPQTLPPVSPARNTRPFVPTRTVGVQRQRTFTKTTQGRRYDNGLVLRKGVVVTADWQKRYFHKGHYHFPWYRPVYVNGSVLISPFGFYFGVCAPWIQASACSYYPPQEAFVDEPVYNNNDFGGYSDTSDPNYLNDQNLDQDEPGLGSALNELTETFQSGNIDGIVSLVNPNMRVAIYEEGSYKYSMESNDFLDLTRDAIQSRQASSFTITYLHQRAPSVFAVDAQDTYKDPDGSQRSVYCSFVLQDVGGLWTLTQVETSPDVNQNIP